MRYQLTKKELSALMFLSNIPCLPGVDTSTQGEDDAVESLLNKGYVIPCSKEYRLDDAVSRMLTAWRETLYIMSRTMVERQVGLLVNYDSFLCCGKMGDAYVIQHVMNEGDNLDEWICRINGLAFRPHMLDSFLVRVTPKEGKHIVGGGAVEDFGNIQKKYGIPLPWLRDWQTNMHIQAPGTSAVSTIRDIKGNREVKVLFRDSGDAIYMCAQDLGADPYVAIARGGTRYVVSLIYNL